MAKILKLTDNVNKIQDATSLTGGLNLSKGFKTEVIAKDEFGKELFRKSNILVAGGQRFVLEKVFNIDPNLSSNRITLNKIYSHENTETPITDLMPRREKAVCLFGIGIGGSELTMGSAVAPHNRNFNLYNQIPFRVVPLANDLSSVVKSQYYFRRSLPNNRVGYYLKRFATTPKINMLVNGVNFVPNQSTDNTYVGTADQLIQNQAVEIYLEFNLFISELDIREYFTVNEGLQHARINEISLFTGYQEAGVDWREYKDVECFSKLTFDNEPFTNPSKTVEVIYRIYL